MDLINLTGNDVVGAKGVETVLGTEEQILSDLLLCFQTLVNGQHDSDKNSLPNLVSEHSSAVKSAMVSGKSLISIELDQFTRDNINFPGDSFYAKWTGVSENGDGEFAQVVNCGFIVVDFNANYPSYCDDEYDVGVNANLHLFNTKKAALEYANTLAGNAYKHDMRENISVLKTTFSGAKDYLSKDYCKKVEEAINLLDQLG